MYAFGDASLLNVLPPARSEWTVFGNAFDLGFATSYLWNGDIAAKVDIDWANRRHGGRFVVLSVDGHGESIASSDEYDPFAELTVGTDPNNLWDRQ
jgi:hypothetical protein